MAPRGWRNEPARHALAAKGLHTVTKGSGKHHGALDTFYTANARIINDQLDKVTWEIEDYWKETNEHPYFELEEMLDEIDQYSDDIPGRVHWILDDKTRAAAKHRIKNLRDRLIGAGPGKKIKLEVLKGHKVVERRMFAVRQDAIDYWDQVTEYGFDPRYEGYTKRIIEEL